MSAQKLNGRWIYRSYFNDPVLVGNDAQKALALIFGEGVLTVTAKDDRIFTSTLDFGGGSGMDLYGEVVPGVGVNPEVLIITGTGREGTSTAKWVYQYVGYVVPAWPEGHNEVPAIVGTVIRTIPHQSGTPGKLAPAGVTASFVMLRQPAPRGGAGKPRPPAKR